MFRCGTLRCIMGTSHRVGYARVSTLDQNPELQLDALKAAGCKKIFVEKVSSSKEARPQLAAALEHLRSGDTLVVWKLDRLARSMKQLLETVDTLKGRGVGFQALTEAIDTTSAAGELFFHIFGALAQFERSIIRERTKAGLKAALARGRKGGRPQRSGKGTSRRHSRSLAILKYQCGRPPSGSGSRCRLCIVMRPAFERGWGRARPKKRWRRGRVRPRLPHVGSPITKGCRRSRRKRPGGHGRSAESGDLAIDTAGALMPIKPKFRWLYPIDWRQFPL